MRLIKILFSLALFHLCCFAQVPAEFTKTLPVSNTQPVTLRVDIEQGDLEILYNHDGEVAIHAVAMAAPNATVDAHYFSSALVIEQEDHAIRVVYRPRETASSGKLKLRFRIYVPFRTAVTTSVQQGATTLRGFLGPVDAHTLKGDISASYISQQVHAEAEDGNLDFQVIGEPVLAKVGRGNITGQRLEKGIAAHTDDGDISLMVIGPSLAEVAHGAGRIEVGGARSTLTLRTDAGDLQVTSSPYDDWHLDSTTGNIRLHLPPTVNLRLEASSDQGELKIERDDLAGTSDKFLSRITRQAGAGSKLIAAHTEKGRITIR